MVSFVDDHDIGEFCDATEPLGGVTLAAEVRMAEDREVAEIGVAADAADMWQPFS